MQHIMALLDRQYRDASVDPINVGQSGSKVYRLRPKKGSPAILKVTCPANMPDYLTAGYPQIGVTEYRFYTELLPKLEIPAPGLLDYGNTVAGESYLLLQDLSTYCYIPPEDHMWTTQEIERIVATYAMLHGRSERLFQTEGLPAWLNPDPTTRYNAEVTLSLLLELHQNSWTQELVAPIVKCHKLEPLLERLSGALKHVPPGLLFNDFYPPNVALPAEGGAALLFDYQLIGSGPFHIDIVNIGFLGLTPAFKEVDRDALLTRYLTCLEQETGKIVLRDGFLEDFRFATLLAWADFLPRFVRAMHRSNLSGEPWGKWMDETYATCMREWIAVLK